MSQGGRPTEYKPEHCAELLEHMQSGLTYESFAGRIGVCRQTLYNWEKEHPEFLDTKKRAQAMALYHWDQLGADSITASSKDDAINVALYIHRMRVMFGWRATDNNNPVVEVEKKDDKLVLNFPKD